MLGTGGVEPPVVPGGELGDVGVGVGGVGGDGAITTENESVCAGAKRLVEAISILYVPGETLLDGILMAKELLGLSG